LQEGIVFTVDSTAGLRAWSMKGEQKLLAGIRLRSTEEAHGGGGAQPLWPLKSKITMGKASKWLLALQMVISAFTSCKAGAYLCPPIHTFAVVERHDLSHRTQFSVSPYDDGSTAPLALLLQFQAGSPIVRGCLGPSSFAFIVAIPYGLATAVTVSASFFRKHHRIYSICLTNLPLGWSVGLQELRITLEGDVMESRLASAVDQGFHPLSSMSYSSTSPSSRINPSPTRRMEVEPPLFDETDVSIVLSSLSISFTSGQYAKSLLGNFHR
jgi:hypothetical protein